MSRTKTEVGVSATSTQLDTPIEWDDLCQGTATSTQAPRYRCSWICARCLRERSSVAPHRFDDRAAIVMPANEHNRDGRTGEDLLTTDTQL